MNGPAGVEEEEEGLGAVSQFPPIPVYAQAYGPPLSEMGPDGTVVEVERPVHQLAVSKDPPVPPEGKYRCFGDIFDPDEKAKTLKEEGREELFERSEDGKEIDYAVQVKRLCAMALSNYREFLKTLTDMDDKTGPEKAENFTNMFINILYLVNQLRPSQGRQVLINMMEKQIKERTQATKKLNEAITASRAAIDQAIKKAALNAALIKTNEDDTRGDVEMTPI